MIDRAYIDELIHRNDIEGVIGESITLKRNGTRYVGLCPFHNEKTPSFSVNAQKQFYHCFGCGAGGNVISFVQQYKNVGFVEAVGILAARVGMNLPDEPDEAAQRRSTLLKINKLAAKFFYEKLLSDDGKKAREYLVGRGLQKEMVTRFGIGYAPDNFDEILRHLRNHGFSDEMVELAGLARRGSRGHYAFFRDRVMFPIIDLQNNVIAFGGRLIEGNGPKYVNTSDTPVFNKGRGLFALNLAKKESEKTYLLCEGYMDVVALHSAGFKTAVATLGTALTAEQAKLISVYAERAVLCYDSDEAGQRATKKATAVFADLPTQISILDIEGAKDPDEYIKLHGKEKFAGLLSNSKNTLEYTLAGAKFGLDLTSDEGRATYVRKAVGVLADMSRTPTEREVYAGRIELETGVSKASILQQIKSQQTGNRKKREREEFKDNYNPYGFGQQYGTYNQKTLYAVNQEQKLVAAVLMNPSLFEAVGERMAGYEFCETTLKTAFYLAKGYFDSGHPAEFAVVAGCMPEGTGQELTSALARFADISPDARDVSMYVDNILASATTEKEMDIDDLDAYIKSLRDKKT